jgi:cellulose biosynthesis protein BcsQ
MLEDLNRNADMGHRPGILKALIYGTDRSKDCQLMADTIRQSFRNTHKVQILNTVIPSCVAFRAAATSLMPAYEYELANRNKAKPAYNALHELVWELFSNFRDIYYDEARPAPSDRDAQGEPR